VVAGPGLHVGRGVRLWAPNRIVIGANVYIGKDVHVEANAHIDDFALLANRVSIVGAQDHDMRQIGVPVRFSTWIGDRPKDDPIRAQRAEIGKDVWVGYGATILSGVKIGRGAIIAAGAVVTRDVSAYEIVAGVPAVRIGLRYSDVERAAHEHAMDSGVFRYSARGSEFWTVRPGMQLELSQVGENGRR
jgi:acetyltransferase-like isoleucine patch superfamily enzyme